MPSELETRLQQQLDLAREQIRSERRKARENSRTWIAQNPYGAVTFAAIVGAAIGGGLVLAVL